MDGYGTGRIVTLTSLLRSPFRASWMRARTGLKWAVRFAVLLWTAVPPPAPLHSQERDTAHVFFSSGCGDCLVYLEEDLEPALIRAGWEGAIQTHDYLSPPGRTLLSQLAREIGLSEQIRSSLYVFLPRQGTMLVLLGHVPGELVEEALSLPEWPPELVISQPEMMGLAPSYSVGNYAGTFVEFSIETPLLEALERWGVSSQPSPGAASSLVSLIPLVAVAGLIDGVNPCAFAVILLLIAFLYTIRRACQEILALGGAYILAVYSAYFVIGLGLLQAVILTPDPHLLAKLAALLLIVLGALSLVGATIPEFPLQLHMPAFAQAKIHELVKRASLPATLGMGFLVGLCTFPCSGGVYVSIVTLLAAQTTALWGVLFLAFYNLMYVMPLGLILIAAGNRVTAKAWAAWERSHSGAIHLAYAVGLIGLGLIVWLWAL